MVGRTLKRNYLHISCISFAVVAIVVLVHLHLDSWDLTSDRKKKPRHIEQPLGAVPPRTTSEQNVSLPGEVSNEGSMQYNAWETLVAKIQYNRQQRVSQMCNKKRNLIPTLPLENYITGWAVDPNHGIAFRATPKAGSTSWLCVMASALSGIPASNTSYKDVYLLRNSWDWLKWKNGSVEDLKYALREYNKFVFVRHPLSRLLSAYLDKIAYWRKGRNQKFREMKDEILTFSTNKSTNSDKYIAFPDFVRYIIAARNLGNKLNYHWRPLTLLLQPCQLHYNFIGKIETLVDDSKYVFQNVFHDPSLILPRRNSANLKKVRNYTKSIQEYYDELTSEELADVIDIYEDDFAIFGYEKFVPAH